MSTDDDDQDAVLEPTDPWEDAAPVKQLCPKCNGFRDGDGGFSGLPCARCNGTGYV